MTQSDFVGEKPVEGAVGFIPVAPEGVEASIKTITIGGKNITKTLLNQLDLVEKEYYEFEDGDLVWGRVDPSVFGFSTGNNCVLFTDKAGALKKGRINVEKPENKDSVFRADKRSLGDFWLADHLL